LKLSHKNPTASAEEPKIPCYWPVFAKNSLLMARNRGNAVTFGVGLRTVMPDQFGGYSAILTTGLMV
jgi:hypothetical protein